MPIIQQLMQMLSTELQIGERIPLEAGLSYLLPLVNEKLNIPCLCGFTLLCNSDGERVYSGVILSRVTIKYKIPLEIIAYEDKDIIASLNYRMRKDILVLGSPIVVDRSTRLILESELYDSISKVMPEITNRNTVNCKFLRIKELVEQLSPPELLPFYRAINPILFQ